MRRSSFSFFSNWVVPALVAWEQHTLRFLAHLTTTYAKMVLCLCFALVGFASFYTARQLEFVTGRNELISTDKRYVQLDEEYAQEFVGVDQLVVVVEPRDAQQGKDFASRLGEMLARDTAHVKEVFYRIDATTLEGQKLLYLSAEDLRNLADNLEGAHDLVHDITTNPGLNTLFQALNRQVSAATVSYLVENLLGLGPPDEPEEPASEPPAPNITFLNTLLQEMERALIKPDYRYRSPWAEFFGDTGELADDGFLVSGNRRFVFLMVEPKASPNGGFGEYQESIAAIRQAIDDLLPAFPGLEAGVTGTKVLDNDEMLSAQTDTAAAAIVSFLGITLLYVLFFKKLRHPGLIVSSLTVGLCWTMGFVTLTVGHLTIITVFVAPMLLGLADDFGVHFMTRYEEERGRGQDPAAALSTVFETTVPSIVAGACTTALAFAAVMLADFRGVQELGLISSGGILLSLLAMLTFLPALVVVIETYRPWQAAARGRTFLTGAFVALGTVTERGRRPILVLAGLLTLGALATLPTISFDYNLLNLQAHGTESVEWEMRIIENSERSSWNALATAPTPEEAMRKAALFEALPSVETVESVASLIPSGQAERLELVRALQPLLSNLPPTLAPPAPVDIADLERSLDKIRFKVREENEEWDPQAKPTESELSEARRRLLAVIERLRTLPESRARAALEWFQQALFHDFQDKWSLLRNNLNPAGPITLADIPDKLKRRFVNEDGTRFLLQIYPQNNIREREPLEEFIHQLRQVDPNVTGSPIIGYETITAMKEGYIEAAFYAFMAIIVVTFLALRRLGDTFLAMVPLGLGMIWAAGFMWLCNLQFNLANMVAAPLIIGIGIENGIHLVHRFRENEQASVPVLVAGSTGQAVALFSLTTMGGFGSLMVAKYYGIFSIGLLLTIAVGSVLVASLTILPLLLFRPAPEAPHALPEASLPEAEPPELRRAGRRG